jgi:hypothetical protein
MVWIFASVVLILAVVHPGFRKVVLWLLAIAAVLIGALVCIEEFGESAYAAIGIVVVFGAAIWLIRWVLRQPYI